MKEFDDYRNKEKAWQESDYEGFFAQRLIDMYSEGYTKAQFCASINISLPTFHNWLKEHADFADAYRVARAKAHSVYDKKLINATETTQLPHDHIRKIHKMRFHDGYSEDLLEKLEPTKLEDCLAKCLEYLRVGRITPVEFTQMTHALTEMHAAMNENVLEERLAKVEESLNLKAENATVPVNSDGILLAKEPADAKSNSLGASNTSLKKKIKSKFEQKVYNLEHDVKTVRRNNTIREKKAKQDKKES